jgi:hypothetical protein
MLEHPDRGRDRTRVPARGWVIAGAGIERLRVVAAHLQPLGLSTTSSPACLQVDDLVAIGDWYDQIVSVAGGTRTFDMPNLIGYALPGQPTQLFFSLATSSTGRPTPST